MLVLSSVNKLLGHVLAPPALHTAVLFTASGSLVSYSTAGPEPRPKDDIRVLVGLATEVWAETAEDGEGMVDSEVCELRAAKFVIVIIHICRRWCSLAVSS